MPPVAQIPDTQPSASIILPTHVSSHCPRALLVAGGISRPLSASVISWASSAPPSPPLPLRQLPGSCVVGVGSAESKRRNAADKKGFSHTYMCMQETTSVLRARRRARTVLGACWPCKLGTLSVLIRRFQMHGNVMASGTLRRAQPVCPTQPWPVADLAPRRHLVMRQEFAQGAWHKGLGPLRKQL